MLKNKIWWWVWHPILYAAFTVLALFTHNLGEIVFVVIIRPLILAVLFACFLVLIIRLIVRDWNKAGFLATWCLFLFSIYVHVHSLLKVSDFAAMIGRHRYLLPLWLILLIGGIYLSYCKSQSGKRLTLILNVFTITLILFSLFSIAQYYFRKYRAQTSYEISAANFDIRLEVSRKPPDIYYLLLDGYSRSDVLETKFGFDNSEFHSKLEKLGFYVADCSRSNYIHTQLTLPTLLNMVYAEDLVELMQEDTSIEDLPLEYLTKNNRVMTILQSVGYETIAFETSYYWSHFYNADYYFEPTKKSLVKTNLSAFEEMYLDTTIFSILVDWWRFNSLANIQTSIFPREVHYNRINFVLDTLKTIPEMEGPQFTFAHMIIPHKPYIFTENGLITDLNLYNDSREIGHLGQEGYIDNIRFINKEIIVVIEEVLKKSTSHPIIIIQSDHGSDFYDRTMNFSAFYFPDVDNETLYSSITPVNTFRIVFNEYFNSDLELLIDVSYGSENGKFNLIPIEETNPHCLND